MIHPVGQTHYFQRGFNMLASFPAGKPGEKQRQFDVFVGCQYRDKVVKLEDKTDVYGPPPG